MSTPLPTKRLASFSFSAQLTLQSGPPYNITTGRDPNLDNALTQRPSLMPSVTAANCTGGSLIFEPAFGCFNLSPPAGTSIERNYARGPSQNSIAYASLSRTWVLNPKKEVAGKESMVNVPGPGGTTIQVPASMIGNGGGAGARKYSVTLSINAQNPLNHPTWAPPSGDLSSPYFGAYRTLGGGFFGGTATYCRLVSAQFRFSF
jgi:hypothetical protein